MSPLLQLPATTQTLCFCRCHASASGDINVNAQYATAGLPVDQTPITIDPAGVDGAAYRNNWIDATAACPKCVNAHCLALLCEIPELRSVRVRQAFAQAREQRPRIKPKPKRRTKWNDVLGTAEDVTPNDDQESDQG